MFPTRVRDGNITFNQQDFNRLIEPKNTQYQRLEHIFHMDSRSFPACSQEIIRGFSGKSEQQARIEKNPRFQGFTATKPPERRVNNLGKSLENRDFPMVGPIDVAGFPPSGLAGGVLSFRSTGNGGTARGWIEDP
jgi:hypothetical protein